MLGRGKFVKRTRLSTRKNARYSFYRYIVIFRLRRPIVVQTLDESQLPPITTPPTARVRVTFPFLWFGIDRVPEKRRVRRIGLKTRRYFGRFVEPIKVHEKLIAYTNKGTFYESYVEPCITVYAARIWTTAIVTDAIITRTFYCGPWSILSVAE